MLPDGVPFGGMECTNVLFCERGLHLASNFFIDKSTFECQMFATFGGIFWWVLGLFKKKLIPAKRFWKWVLTTISATNCWSISRFHMIKVIPNSAFNFVGIIRFIWFDLHLYIFRYTLTAFDDMFSTLAHWHTFIMKNFIAILARNTFLAIFIDKAIVMLPNGRTFIICKQIKKFTWKLKYAN